MNPKSCRLFGHDHAPRSKTSGRCPIALWAASPLSRQFDQHRGCRGDRGTSVMVVRAGREFLAVPGPTMIPDEVLGAMHRPAIDIYSGPLLAVTDSLLRDLRRLFSTSGRCYIYIANGHGA